MSCSNCSKVVSDELPQLVPASSGQVASPVCDDATSSQESSGCKLDSCLTDPRTLQEGEGMTLLGRVGDILARFKGNGFIEVRSGLAYLVHAPALRVKEIWSQWKQASPGAYPTAGDPLPFPYSTAVDPNGVIHALLGLEDSDSIQVWDKTSRQWSVIKVSDLAQKVNKALPQSDHIELTGYEEVGMMASSCGQDREMKALRGNGVVYLEKVPVNDCEDPCSNEAFAYVARSVDFPEVVADETYSLQFSSSGLSWVQNA